MGDTEIMLPIHRPWIL